MSGWLSGWSSESGGSQRQGQRQIQKKQTESLEQQVVFLDQLRKCFRLVDMHLENIVADESAEELDDSASSMVTGLNLVRMAVQDLKGNKTALGAGKSELVTFIQGCERKYGSVEGPKLEKVMKMVGAARAYIGCVLSGRDVPVMQINGLDSKGCNDAALANSAMQFVILGAHREGDLRKDVQANPRQYASQVAQEARRGAQFDKTFDVQFDPSSQEVLQGDMIKLTAFADESYKQAQQSLQRMIDNRWGEVQLDHEELPDADNAAPVAAETSPWGMY